MTDLADKLERLSAEATPGEWCAEPHGAVSANVRGVNRQVASVCGEAAQHDEGLRDERAVQQANTVLIVALRNALPDIIAALRAAAWRGLTKGELIAKVRLAERRFGATGTGPDIGAYVTAMANWSIALDERDAALRERDAANVRIAELEGDSGRKSREIWGLRRERDDLREVADAARRWLEAWKRDGEEQPDGGLRDMTDQPDWPTIECELVTAIDALNGDDNG